MILVDTSVWIDYLRHGAHEQLEILLDGESVVMHDFVYGEIAMGSLKHRAVRLAAMRRLHRVPTASNFEFRNLLENAKLFGLGLTFVDVHLLTAALASSDREPVRLWTGDQRLRQQATRLGVAYSPA